MEGLEKLEHCPGAPSGRSVKAPLSELLVVSVAMGASPTFTTSQGHPTPPEGKSHGDFDNTTGEENGFISRMKISLAQSYKVLYPKHKTQINETNQLDLMISLTDRVNFS